MSSHEIRLRGPWTAWYEAVDDRQSDPSRAKQRINLTNDPTWRNQIVALGERGSLVMERRFQWPRAGDATASVTLCLYGGHRLRLDLNGERVALAARAVVTGPSADEDPGDAVLPVRSSWVADVTPLLRPTNTLRVSIAIAEGEDVATQLFEEALLRIEETSS